MKYYCRLERHCSAGPPAAAVEIYVSPKTTSRYRIVLASGKNYSCTAHAVARYAARCDAAPAELAAVMHGSMGERAGIG